MWLRIIGRINQSYCVVLPIALMHSLGWARGDHVQISIAGENKVLISKLDVAKLSDAALEALKELPEIK